MRGYFGVHRPLFHGTTEVGARQIVRRGLVSNRKDDVGVSTYNNLDLMLKGVFGNHLFLLDADDVKGRWQITPVSYPDGKDLEHRVIVDRIPPSFLRGLILADRPSRFSVGKYREYPFPVVYPYKSGWTVAE